MAAILCHVTTNFSISKPNRNLEMSKSINQCDIKCLHNLYLIKVLFVVHGL